jgi:hypothetical protein
VVVSVTPVGSGTVGLLPMNGYPSPLAGAPAGRADATPTVGSSGNPKCGVVVVCCGSGARVYTGGGSDGRSSDPALGAGAE